jgi:hypothetical protein
MGVRRLPSPIKDTKGTAAYDLENQVAHVDVKSFFFNIVRARSFDILVERVAKEQRDASTNPMLIAFTASAVEPAPADTTLVNLIGRKKAAQESSSSSSKESEGHRQR